MNGCATCLDNAERAWLADQRADAAIRCCETGHRPAYRRGRLVGQLVVERACRLAYQHGRRRGAETALVGVAMLGLCALGLRRRYA